ncbi:MAG: DUF2752 domain-containing protein [Erysipelotrichales bacterium]|nr:DUF2752 domain-containing protein [Erysipelotrichales bacterium]
MNKNQRKTIVLIIPVILLMILAFYLNFVPGNNIRLWGCPFYNVTGFSCPGCGATRAVIAILTFRFIEAMQYNFAFFILFFVITFIYIFNIYRRIRFKQSLNISYAFIIACGIFLFVFTVIRNLPFYPYL